MRTTLFKPIALLTATLLCAPSLRAQVGTERKPVPAKPAAPATPAPPAPPVAPAVPVRLLPGGAGAAPVLPVPSTSVAGKLDVLQVPFSELQVAVDILQGALDKVGLDQLNILFGPDTKNLEVSDLTVRNVTGPDALHLIAAAAGCTVEPMLSTEPLVPGALGARAMVIGYQLRGKAKPATAGRAAPGGGMPPAMKPGMPGLPAGAMLPVAAAKTARTTRIYPLGAVTAATKFPDLEKTLREIFKADGVAEKEVSLALHEKTNVLVVNAGEQVHNLVEQFLTALNTNTSQAERLNTTRDRAMGREELEAAARAQRRLEQELAERDAQMRELQKELRKLQDAVQKPPSAK